MTSSVRVERFAPGEGMPAPQAGDFILVRGRGFISVVVYTFQALRFRAPEERRYTYWSHAALVVSPAGRIVEVGPRGVWIQSLERYRGSEYHYVHVPVPADRRREVARFAEACAGQRYGVLTLLALGFLALVGWRLSLPDRGQQNCVAVIARALERATGERFVTTPANMMPADLAKHFGITP